MASRDLRLTPKNTPVFPFQRLWNSQRNCESVNTNVPNTSGLMKDNNSSDTRFQGNKIIQPHKANKIRSGRNVNLPRYQDVWWRHKMEAFSALLAICEENSPVPGGFPAQRPVTRSFDVLIDLCLNKQLSKQSWGWWFETLSHPLWRHCNGFPRYENWGIHILILFWLSIIWLVYNDGYCYMTFKCLIVYIRVL